MAPPPAQMLSSGKKNTPKSPVMISAPEYVIIASIYEHQLLGLSSSLEQNFTLFLSIYFILFPLSLPLSSEARSHQSLLRLAEPRPLGTQTFIVYMPFLHKQSDSPNWPLNQAQEVTFLIYFLCMSRGKSCTSFILDQMERLS